MRNISFALTTDQIRRREKTVTRRDGWWRLEPGTILQAVEKAQGLRKGEHVKPLGLIRVVSVRTERLCDITAEDVCREGFPGLTPLAFIQMFTDAHRRDGFLPTTLVNRIEFEYVEP